VNCIPTLRSQILELGSAIRQLRLNCLDSATAQLLRSRKRSELEDLLNRARKPATVEVEPMPREPIKWYDHIAPDNPPFINTLAEVRRLAVRSVTANIF
jgi:hypothetical protein